MSQAIQAIAIDDEPKALEVIQIHAEKVPFLELKAMFTNAFEALDYLRTNQVDLIFLDIRMPDITGLELLSSLNSKPFVVFTTAYSEYAVQGFEVDALDYLLKPFSFPRFLKACNKASEVIQKSAKSVPESIFLKTGYQEEKVFLDEIHYIEAEGNYLNVILTERRVVVRMTLNEMSELLPTNLFLRIHRSYLIALDKIEKIAKNAVEIKSKEIAIGASYEEAWAEAKAKLR